MQQTSPLGRRRRQRPRPAQPHSPKKTGNGLPRWLSCWWWPSCWSWAAAAGALYQGLSGGKEILSLSYRRAGEECGETDSRSVREETEALYRLLCSRRAADQAAGFTTAGPHRDDLIIEINQLPARAFGSQGQQRTAALSLKLSEIELVKQEIKDTPVLLLDDVLSELDSNRQKYLLDGIHDIQTLITCTGLDEFVENRFEINKVFQVSDGVVT